MVVVFFLINCTKKPDPAPCSNFNPVSANFNVKDNNGILVPGYEVVWANYSSDSVYSKRVLLTAIEENAVYSWKIGNHTFGEKKLEVIFPDSVKSFPVQLIINKKPNNDCFPEDDGVDSLSKNITFLDPATTPFKGAFFGFDNLKNKHIGIVFTKFSDRKAEIHIIDPDTCKNTYYSDLGREVLTFSTILENYNSCKNIFGGKVELIHRDTIKVSLKKGTVKTHESYNFIGIRRK